MAFVALGCLATAALGHDPLVAGAAGASAAALLLLGTSVVWMMTSRVTPGTLVGVMGFFLVQSLVLAGLAETPLAEVDRVSLGVGAGAGVVGWLLGHSVAALRARTTVIPASRED